MSTGHLELLGSIHVSRLVAVNIVQAVTHHMDQVELELGVRKKPFQWLRESP